MFTKADIILAVFLIAAGFAMSFWLAAGREDGSFAEVRVDGELFGTYDLEEDRTVDIRRDGHLNRFRISDGSIAMIKADCRNHDCIRQGSIHRTGETIVCLPHKIVIEIKGGKRDYDTIAR